MKTRITFDDWKSLEPILMQYRIGYKVIFDDHHGTAEMIIDIDTINIMRWGNE
jgi:hypothetical protein